MTLPLALSTFSTITLAAQCSSDSGAQFCLDSGAAWDMRAQYCQYGWNTINGRVGVDSTGNVGQIFRNGIFINQQECWNILEDILNSCYGNTNSGSWRLHGLYVNFNYCLDISNEND